MCMRLIFAIFFVMLLPRIGATIAEEPPRWALEKDVPQKLCERLYPEWCRIHTAAARNGELVRADLIINPESRTISLERGDRNSSSLGSIKLPSAMKWRAFRVSVQGITELSLPVSLQRPHHQEHQMPQDDEEVWIFGDAKETRMSFCIGSRSTGSYCIGSGRGWNVRQTEAFKVRMPAVQEPGFRSKVSMLPPGVRQGQPVEFIESNGPPFLEVVRDNTQ